MCSLQHIDCHHHYFCLPHFFLTWRKWTSKGYMPGSQPWPLTSIFFKLLPYLCPIRAGLCVYAPWQVMFYTIHSFLSNCAPSSIMARERREAMRQHHTLHWASCYLVTQSCLTLYDAMDCSPSGSSVHGSLQARILEWVATSFSRGPSQPRDQTHIS